MSAVVTPGCDNQNRCEESSEFQGRLKTKNAAMKLLQTGNGNIISKYVQYIMYAWHKTDDIKS